TSFGTPRRPTIRFATRWGWSARATPYPGTRPTYPRNGDGLAVVAPPAAPFGRRDAFGVRRLQRPYVVALVLGAEVLIAPPGAGAVAHPPVDLPLVPARPRQVRGERVPQDVPAPDDRPPRAPKGLLEVVVGRVPGDLRPVGLTEGEPAAGVVPEPRLHR